MEIKTKIKTRSEEKGVDVIYKDIESISELNGIEIHHVAGYAFCDGKLVIVRDGAKNAWTPASGGVEQGESVEVATLREIKEESNMKVLFYRLLGYQAISETHRTTNQTRSFCIVEPFGPFVSDPDNDIVEIKLIEPSEYKNYFDWGVVGEHLMKRSLELLSKYNTNH